MPTSSDLPAPSARRLPRPRWLDTRLLFGVLLVLVAVVVGARVVAAADDTVPVWAMRKDVGPKSTISADDLVSRQVRLDRGLAKYFQVAQSSPVGMAALRVLGAGELVPRAAVVSPRGLDIRRVALGVDEFAAGSLERGSLVDVYHVPDGAVAAPAPAPQGTARSGASTPPARARLLLSSISVDAVSEGGKGLGSSAGQATVVLLLDRTQVPAFLDAQASGRVELVQLPFPEQEHR